MKVLLVTNMYPTDEDPSFGTFVRDQVETLRARGVEIDVLFVNGRANRFNYLKGVWQMRSMISRGDYDLVHGHYVYSGFIARLQRRVPVIVTFHGEPIKHEALLSRLLAPRVDACTVTSEQHKKHLRYDRARVVPCGVDLQMFKPMPQAEARAALGWNVHRKVMTYIGAHRPEKRVEIVKAAYEILRTEHRDLDLSLPHGLPHDQIPLYMNAADVLVLASDYEGSPMVIKEAMACNLPIVSTPVGDVPEVIGGTEGCFICEQTAEDVAAKVELALAFGRRTNGRDAVGHLQTSCEVDRVLEMYNDVLSRRSRSTGSTGTSSSERGPGA